LWEGYRREPELPVQRMCVRQARGISQVNVCRVYEVFSHVLDSGEHIWFLSMELLAGQTLAERLRQKCRIPSKQALNLVVQMIAGLAAAHEHKVVHRDFKSSNVMLVESPTGRTRAVVTDFGLALSKTFEWLECAYQDGSPDLIELNSEPIFDRCETIRGSLN
jgi:serine/threonine protein kinase